MNSGGYSDGEGDNMDEEEVIELELEYDPYAQYEEYDEEIASLLDEDQHGWSFYEAYSVSEY